MIKLPYTYNGMPIGTATRYGRRIPVRPKKGKPWKTVLIILIFLGLIGTCVWYLLRTEDSGTAAAEQKTESAGNTAVAAVSADTVQQTAEAVPEIPSTPVVSANTNQPEKPAETAGKTAPAAETPTWSQELAAFDAEILKLLQQKKHEQVREKLDKLFRTLDVKDPYYPRAQHWINQCAVMLHQKGAFSQTTTDYTVRSGDMLSKIAKKHGVGVQAIVKASGMANPNRLSPGQVLKIPKNTWTAKISTGKGKLFIYENNRLVCVYSLNIAPGSNVPDSGSFRVGASNQEWKIYGLSRSNTQNLRMFLPAGTVVTIGK